MSKRRIKAPVITSAGATPREPLALGGGKAIAQLAESARKGRLIAVIGTGVSLALTDAQIEAVSWRGLIEHGFAYAAKKGKLAERQVEFWRNQTQSDDLDDLLTAAEFVGRKLGAPDGDLYARWLEDAFQSVRASNAEMADAVRALHASGVPICTSNYDSLLEQATGTLTINLTEINRAAAWMRREACGILHLHGAWDAPTTCILGIRDYEKTLHDEARDLIQRSLSAFQHLLFVGCGDTFADPNFSALIQWLRKAIGTGALQHYALVQESDFAKRHADPAWHGFVEPISSGPNHSKLTGILKGLASAAAKSRSLSSSIQKVQSGSEERSRIIEHYRKFLIKDCGQMTIEGIRADYETTQRKFDLERIFVPLEITESPPELPESDPERERKLASWRERHAKSLAFGGAFAKHKRLVILALPGGGKTLPLKRLAVAYADPERRGLSEDKLPNIDLMPVLIRCREWRAHIGLPIASLLDKVPEITGQPELIGFAAAVRPLLEAGRVLLLIDGLDEIHNADGRSTFVENLEKFLEEYPENSRGRHQSRSRFQTCCSSSCPVLGSVPHSAPGRTGDCVAMSLLASAHGGKFPRSRSRGREPGAATAFDASSESPCGKPAVADNAACGEAWRRTASARSRHSL